MSKTPIPIEVRRDLWFDAHGRCEFEGCNKPLYEHGVTMQKINLSQYAHIIADSPKGPRGDEILSEQLAQDKSNLMLLCPDCHTLIDNNGMVGLYSKERLRLMKKTHEGRIRLVTSINPEKKSTIVTYTANIGKQRIAPISFEGAAAAMFPHYYPSSSMVINLGQQGSAAYDDNQLFWLSEKTQLEEKVKEIPGYRDGNTGHLSIFAIAPQPLLVLLGTLLGGINQVRVFQKHRITEDWKWRPSDTDNEILIEEPGDTTKPPVIVFGLSDNAIIRRVEKRYGDAASIWKITCKQPGVDILDSEDKLIEFSMKTRLLLNRVHEAACGRSVQIHMAMPVAMAVALGRARLQKASPEWDLYDYRDGVDAKVLTIK